MNEKELKAAFEKDNVDAVKKIFETQKDVLAFIKAYNIESGWSMAIDAAAYGAYHCLVYIIQYMHQLVNDMGGDQDLVKNYINERSSTGHAPLHLAVEHGSVACVKFLLDEGADPNLKIKNDYEFHDTSMAIACWKNHLEMLKLLMEYGGKLDIKRKYGKTLLHIAAWGNAFECAAFLVEQGADVSARNDSGKTPLMYAQDREQINDIRITQLLIEHGADVNAADKNGETPLHVAAENDNEKHIRFLLAHGANINAQDDKGRTPLHVSMHCGNIKDREGNYYYSEAAFAELLEHHPDLELADTEEGYTPLLQAAWESSCSQMEDLLAAGADIHARDYSDHNVLDVILTKTGVDYYPGGGRLCCEVLYPYLNEEELVRMDAHITLQEQIRASRKPTKLQLAIREVLAKGLKQNED